MNAAKGRPSPQEVNRSTRGFNMYARKKATMTMVVTDCKALISQIRTIKKPAPAPSLMSVLLPSEVIGLTSLGRKIDAEEYILD